jgi:hypothetical protein
MHRPSYLRPVCRTCGQPRFVEASIIYRRTIATMLRAYADIVSRHPPPDQIVDMHADGTMRWIDAGGRPHAIHLDQDDCNDPRELTPAELASIGLE